MSLKRPVCLPRFIVKCVAELRQTVLALHLRRRSTGTPCDVMRVNSVPSQKVAICDRIGLWSGRQTSWPFRQRKDDAGRRSAYNRHGCINGIRRPINGYWFGAYVTKLLVPERPPGRYRDHGQSVEPQTGQGEGESLRLSVPPCIPSHLQYGLQP